MSFFFFFEIILPICAFYLLDVLTPGSLRDSTETCVSMADMKFVPRCITKIYSRHYQRLYPKYVCVLHVRPEIVLPERSIRLLSLDGSI